MAGSQARTRIFSLLLPILALLPGIEPLHDTQLKEFPSHVFRRHLKVARHNPFCVVLRKTATGSKLETSIHKLWKKAPVEANYTKWEVAALNLDQTQLTPKHAAPDKLPSVRCYLGETSKYDYMGKVSGTGLRSWLTQLNSIHEEQTQEVTQKMVTEVMSKFHVVLLAFPDGPRHHQIEDLMYELAASIDNCKAMAIHLHAPEVMKLREMFGVKSYPSVVVIHIHRTVVNGTNKTVSDHRVFSGLECESFALRLYVHAKAMDIPLLNLESMGELLSTKSGESFRFTPVLVCLYDRHRDDAITYITAFNMSVARFTGDGVQLRYGLLDISQKFINRLVARHLEGVTMKRIPFLALFNKGEDGSMKHTELYIDWPYPWVLYPALRDVSPGLAHQIGLTEYEPPWGVATVDMFSNMSEGPNGTLCTSWSHNQTDNTPAPRKVKVKTIRVIKKPISKEQQLHDMFDTDKLEKKLSSYESIPLLTLETWSDIVEKSHAPRHIFYSAGRWAGEVTKVSLVVFIMADCGNCRRKNETFREIRKAVEHIDGGAMYYVNCTAEPLLCQRHNIRGYPTISVYRGLGWMGKSACLSNDSQKAFRNYVRLDYHDPIMTKLVMEWFSRMADNAVTNMKLNKPPRKFQRKDVRVMATVLPKSSATPVPVTSSSATEAATAQFSYKCLRLMCERLYGLLDCYTRYSSQLAESAYAAQDVELYVSKIMFERADGLKATIMKHGVSLHSTLEEEASSNVNRFHKPHSYDLDPAMTCGGDAAACTEVMEQFILDHSRMPVSPITSDMLHTATSPLREETLPIMIALVHPENITTSAKFYKSLTAVAYEFYDQLVVMTLDVHYYSGYATSFVPLKYGKTRAGNWHIRHPGATEEIGVHVFRLWEFKENSNVVNVKSTHPDPYHMFQYPRLCIIRRDDHSHAALYPPYKRSRRRDDFTRSAITAFAQTYLEDPSSLIIETEKF